MIKVVLGIFAAAAVVTAALGFRGQVNGRRPLMLVPDMDFQPRYDAQSASRFFADGRSMRTPPLGTVAFGGAGYSGLPGADMTHADFGGYRADAGSPKQNPDLLAKDPRFYEGREGKAKDGKDFLAEIPVPITLDLLRRGRRRFDIHCAPCHGATGSGNGITTKYGMNVPSYHDDHIRKMRDGEIFDTITRGRNTMRPYAEFVKPADRWAIVAYVRALQRARAGSLADVPEEERSALEKQ